MKPRAIPSAQDGDSGKAPQVSLFAGRRSSDRVYLLLENWFVAHHLRAYGGTSAVLAVAHIDAVLEAQGLTPEQRLQSGIGEACALVCAHLTFSRGHLFPVCPRMHDAMLRGLLKRLFGHCGNSHWTDGHTKSQPC